MNAAHTAPTPAPATLAKGDLVLVLNGYSHETRSRTIADAWSDTYMHVIAVCRTGEALLDYDELGDGEVYIHQDRLQRIA